MGMLKLRDKVYKLTGSIVLSGVLFFTREFTMDSVQKLLGKKANPDEMVRKWRQSIRAQERALDRQLRGMDTEEQKLKRTLKQMAKKNDVKNAKILARELVRSRKQRDRIYTSKAQLNSIIMQLQHQLATLKVSGTLQKSTEVMKMVNTLAKLPEISKSMQELSMEMMKAGIIDEMIEDTMESLEESDVEEEADEEVNKVLFELTDGLLGEAGEVGAPLEIKQQQIEVLEEEEEPELDEMQARLQALKS
ncbi:9766_t:CDS:2 [Ambispora gerdemannii]|uniref:9766_t:CDS:1 n=1 Tax=Ambispora gerdemannii TaxID=144530 RepID=A0A9N9AGT9_9GLOM|nr:9766_t:CDS:2 [Ambispora gerdemannii]